jgi:hypothetical protein
VAWTIATAGTAAADAGSVDDTFGGHLVSTTTTAASIRSPNYSVAASSAHYLI